jgi:ABC-type multidrug transport system fused ATPase/permease subunit
MTVSVAFTVLSIVTMLKAPLESLSNQRLVYIQAKVSLERIDAFLKEPEVSVPAPRVEAGSSPVILTMDELALKKVTAEWPVFIRKTKARSHETRVPFKLTDVDVQFPIGKLSLIVGDTGAGKS